MQAVRAQANFSFFIDKMNSIFKKYNVSFKLPATALLLFLLAFAIYAGFSANKPFYTRGESREAIVSQAILQQDNYILPLRNGLHIPSKPPMFHWLSALSLKAFGEQSELAVRLPSSLIAALTLALVFFAISRIANTSRALTSVLILATTFEWLRSATHARVDMCFAGGITAALFCLYLNFERRKELESSALLVSLAAIATSFAVLAKGPAGLLIILLIAGAHFLLTTGQKTRALLPLFSVTLCTLLLAGTWYYLAFLQGGKDFLEVQLFKENLARVIPVEGDNRGHYKPFYYPVLHLFLGFFPWSLLFPALLGWLWHNKSEVLARKDRPEFFLLIWIAVFLAVTSLSVSKRMVYLLPAFAPTAFLLATALEDIWENQKVYKRSLNFCKWTALLLVSTLFAALLLLPILQQLLELPLAKIELAQAMREKSFTMTKSIGSSLSPGVALGVLTLLSSLVYYLTVNGKKLKLPQSVLLASCFVFLTFAPISLNILPAVAKELTPKHFISRVKEIVPEGRKVYQYGQDLYPLIFYAGEPIETITRISETSLEKKDAYLLARKKDRAGLLAQFPGSKVILESKELAAHGEEKLSLLLIVKGSG